jgi:uncharacterized membrane protein YgcG
VASNAPTLAQVAGRRRSRSRRRGLLVALLVAGAVLAALPVLGGWSLPWAGERLETPLVVQLPGGVTPAAGDPPAVADPAGGDDLPADGGDEQGDRDDGSGGSGRSGGHDSGGGDSGGGGGSSGPG